jgi:hypothetical protein
MAIRQFGDLRKQVIRNPPARLCCDRLARFSDGSVRCGLDQIVGIKMGVPDIEGAGLDVLPQMLPVGADPASGGLAAKLCREVFFPS